MTSDRPVRMVLVAAVADNGVIAHNGALPWDIPEDTEHYLRTVRHHAVLLGRTTYDEIGGPMPDSTTIVQTRDRSWRGVGARVAHDVVTCAPGPIHRYGRSKLTRFAREPPELKS